MKTTTIYTLAHPLTGEIRYVGKTTQKLYNRLNLHVQASRRSTKTKVCAWTKGLINQGLKPVIEYLDHTDGEWQWLEMYWISQFKQWNFNLLNLSDGGEDVSVFAQTERARANRIKSLTGRKRSLEECQAISKGKRGVPVPEERKLRIQQTLKNEVAQYTLDGELIKIHPSINAAAKSIGGVRGNIAKACKGIYSKAYNSTWKNLKI